MLAAVLVPEISWTEERQEKGRLDIPEIDSDGKVSNFRHVDRFVEERKGGTNKRLGQNRF